MQFKYETPNFLGRTMADVVVPSNKPSVPMGFVQSTTIFCERSPA